MPRLQQPVTVAVVGSSLVRGVAEFVNEGKEFDASGYCYPGLTARKINSKIRSIAETQVTVVQAGAINISEQSVDNCTEELRQLIDNVSKKRRNNHVIMALIPHRFDKFHFNKKIDIVNNYIRQEVNKRPNWHLLTHETSRKDHKHDGLHFNLRGSVKYAFEIRHMVRQIMVNAPA